MNPNPVFRRLSAILPGLVLVMSLVVSIYNPSGSATLLSDQVFDIYQRLLPRTVGGAGIQAIYIDIDAETSQRYGAWPWPRKRLQQLIEAVKAQGASAILIDAPLAEPDPTSSRELLKLWRNLPGTGDYSGLDGAFSTLPDPDTVLASTLATTPSVVTFVPGRPAIENRKAITQKAAISQSGGDARHHIENFTDWRASLPLFETAAQGVGAGLVDHPAGGIIRSLPTVVSMDGALYPSALMEMLRVARQAKGYNIAVSEPENGFALEFEPGIDVVSILGTSYAVQTEPDGEMRLYFGGPETRLTVPAWKYIEGAADVPSLNGRIAVVGISVNGTERLLAVPNGLHLASGAIIANGINQIIEGAYLVRPGWAAAAEQVFIFLGGLLVISVVTSFRIRWGVILALLMTAGAAYGSWWAFETHRWLIDPSLPGLTLILAALTCALMTKLHTEDETRFIETQFARRLSSSGLAKVRANPQLIHGEGALRDVTSVAVGLRGFNIIADRYLEDPMAYADILNRFFSPMTKIVQDRNGMVDRTVGDTLYAVWNAPLDVSDHASKGCDAALRMVENLEALNEFLEEDARRQHLSHVPLSLSIGIDSGSAITGNMGAIQRFDYGVLGEPVSFAAYLQRNARNYGPAIIVGEGTQKMVGDRYALLEIDLISTPRHPEGRRVYALLGDPIMRANPKFRALQEAHTLIFAAYRAQRWAEARVAIAECRKLNGAISTLYDFYDARVAQYEAAPPGQYWNGAWFAGRI